MSLGNVLGMYNKFAKYPLGKAIFSKLFCLKAPYFRTISPGINDLKPGHASVFLNQSWGLQNHIKTVHAIAVCNLVEMAMGLVAEATIPSHLRWLPMGMDITYKKKATGRLTATTDIDPETFFTLEKYPGMVKVPVIVHNVEGVEVTAAEVRLWISEKPKK
mmetsp:Transcript_89667/g.175488  ORF Transcript_89667/g.175488 Transcript_89667/m.175488 type:complete len:161 (+) Transcript_89667:157-639(+)|eukprot:CAMPEP_0170376496 /NCGR_PEP_ID=MMETSP0117_2-20130122/11755_1 /TAXON_ID=400756 /ORGANISM="Durinskia baltica, Strain CSIRO CS-38" /LENGTH=160 /DNA_ID=CAMNT_0010631701 /DNA_START=208 /DNA_END=690 /DNA_ORIENTATION=-